LNLRQARQSPTLGIQVLKLTKKWRSHASKKITDNNGLNSIHIGIFRL
jgi:hypothetical protein